MNIKKLLRNPFIFLLPFLLFAIAVVLFVSNNENYGDEIRYLDYASNLTKGYFSNPYPYIDLGNGPGYPLILTPFVASHAPVIILKLLNPVFYYFSIVFIFRSLKILVPFKFAVVVTFIWALYPNLLSELPHVLPEIFASSLVAVIIFCSLSGLRKDAGIKEYKFLLLAGIAFGFLILTKPIFGYVLLTMYCGIFLFWMLKIKNTNYKKTIILLSIAFIVTIPYLIYTYQLTGKMFYWSSFGGNNLYWMSTPFKGEYGEYYRYPFRQMPYAIEGSVDSLKKHHDKDFEEMLKNPEVRKANIINGKIVFDLSNGIAQDDLLKEIALKNIKSHPLKFIENCISNVGRILFNYPASYTLQKPSTLGRLPINGTLIVVVIFCFIPTLLNWTKLDFSIRFLLIFGLIYFGGSLFGSADTRMITKIVPVILIWISYILNKTIRAKLRYEDS
jgi:hypothetical protein